MAAGGAAQRSVKETKRGGRSGWCSTKKREGDLAWCGAKKREGDIAWWWQRVVQHKEARRRHSVVVTAGSAAQRSEKET